MKLYFFPRTRAVRPRWMLEELGIPYEQVSVDLMRGEHKSANYLKIHPLGVVPALDDNGFTLFESTAIVQYLADKHPEKGLAPALGTKERGEYYQWISFAATEADPPVSTIFRHTHVLPEAERSPAAIESASQRFKVVAAVLEERMKQRQYVVGDTFTAADVMVGSVLQPSERLGQLGGFPSLQAYVQRLMERPAAKKVFA